MGTAGVERSTRQNFVASKLKLISSFNFATSRLISITGLGHLIGDKKNSVNSVGTFRVRSGKESFEFKKLLELVWTLVYVFQRSMK